MSSPFNIVNNADELLLNVVSDSISPFDITEPKLLTIPSNLEIPLRLISAKALFVTKSSNTFVPSSVTTALLSTSLPVLFKVWILVVPSATIEFSFVIELIVELS